MRSRQEDAFGRGKESSSIICPSRFGTIVCPQGQNYGKSHTFCDFSHTLSAAGGKVCPQMPDFTLGATAPKIRAVAPLEAKCVQKYRLDANDVQKYYHLRDRWASVLLAAKTANALISHAAQLPSFP